MSTADRVPAYWHPDFNHWTGQQMGQVMATADGRFVRLYPAHEDGGPVNELEVPHTSIAEQLNVAEKALGDAAVAALARDDQLLTVQRALLDGIVCWHRFTFLRRLRAFRILHKQLGKYRMRQLIDQMPDKGV